MGKGSNTTSSTTTSSADPQAASLYRDILTRAQGVASTPYQAYTGDLTAPINSQQQQGIAGINANANYADPYIQQAASRATTSTDPITGQTIQQYQNPYTQQVVDATLAQMRHDNAVQDVSLRGNQIAQGALGGNATGVARGILAGQQGRTMASTTAQLYDQSYKQALAAAQQQQQTGLAGANAMANYGIQGQNAGLAGATAQIGAGSLMQQNEQARLNALYQQYQQAQAYPYQQTQWLAGLGTGVGSQLGGTSSGQTTGPQPNASAQWLGGGLSLASMFLSDRRAKEDIERVGEMDDGTTIYRYRYKGSPEWHIGPMAQEVGQEHVATGVDGMRYMDLKGVTDDAVDRAAGGAVGKSPWEEGLGWIPQIGISAGSGAPKGGAPSLQKPEGGIDAAKMAGQISSIGKGLGGLDWGGAWSAGLGNLSGDDWGGGSFWGGNAYGGSSASPLPGLTAADYGYAAGGAVEAPLQEWLDPEEARYREGDGFKAMMDTPDPFGDTSRVVAHDALRRGDGILAPPELPVFDENGKMMGNQTSSQGVAPASPVPPASSVEPEEEEPAAPPTDTSARSRGVAGAPAPYYAAPDAVTRPQPREESGFGLGILSPNAQTGLMAAGLGMLASRSPNFGNAVGEGGIAGLSAYGSATERDRKIAAEAEKLAREADQTKYERWMGERKQSESERHNQATEKNAAADRTRAPMGMRFNAQGALEPIPGWLPTLEKAAKARKGPEGELMDDETAQFMADRIIAGDTKVLTGLGRGAQGAANIMKVQKLVAQRAASGAEISPAARELLQNAAQFEGLKTAERTQAAIMSKLSVYGRTAFNATEIAERLSDQVDRTQFMPVNKIINAAREKTGDPKIVALGQALMTLTNEYARAIGGGHGTVHDKEAAEKRLSAAQTKEQLRAVINVMRQEILAEEKAMPAARQHIRDIYNPKPGGGVKSIAGEHGQEPPAGPVPGASGFKPPPGAIPRTYNGRVYYYDPATKQPYPGQ